MKKTMIILSAVLALAACTKEMEQAPMASVPAPVSVKYTYNITINRADTKATKSGWEDGDVVYVFFSNIAAPQYLKFTYGNSAWTKTQYNGAQAQDFDFPGDGTMTAVYLPYGSDAVVMADGGSFKFDKTYTSYYMRAEQSPYTVEGTTVSGTLDMTAPEGFVQLAMPATNYFRTTDGITYTLKGNYIKPVSFDHVSADGTVHQSEGSCNAPVTGYVYGGDINFSGRLDPEANGAEKTHEFTFVNDNGTAATYDDVTYLLSGSKTMAYRDAFRFPEISSSAWKVPQPDVLTINGVRWAKWNIGATSAEGYGDYFAWGAVYPQAGYGSGDYREGGTSFSDLTAAQDIATQKLGANWHIPTKAEINSIYDQEGVTWEYTSENGVDGYKVKNAGASDYIFIPAAGCWEGSYQNDGGYYWSATSNYTYGRASYLYLEPWGAHRDESNRNRGFSIRPVYSSSAPYPGPKPINVADATDIGRVIGTDGKIYDTVAAATEAGVTASGMIVYIGNAGSVDESSSTYRGLALALTDAPDGDGSQWGSNGSSSTCLSSANADFSTIVKVLDGIANTNTLVSDSHSHAAASAARNYSGPRPAAGTSGWFLPSIGQWNLIVKVLYKKSSGLQEGREFYTAANVNPMITAAGGTGLKDGYYWSSSEHSAEWAWTYYTDWGGANKRGKTNTFINYVRPVFAF
ncbi:MAG: hypothetical protein IJ652_06740 [Bacteroidales bacterium]|nr:hypothetical protein [Bacteroidales bacterium]